MTQQEELSYKDHKRKMYGEKVASLVRSYGKGVEKLARYKNRVIFNLRCKTSRQIPQSLRVRPPIRTARGQAIAERASFSFLKERIRLSISKKERLEDQRKWTAIGLQRNLREEDFQKVMGMSADREETTFGAQKRKHIEKFDALQRRSEMIGHRKDPRHKQNWVKNLSSHELTDVELKVLERGLNFAPAPTRLRVRDIIAGIEPVLRYHNDKAAANVARAAVCNILRKAKHLRPTSPGKRNRL